MEDLSTNQAQDAIHMVEQLREPTLVCLDLEPQGIVAPLNHPELRRLPKANRGQRDMYSLFLDEGE